MAGASVLVGLIDRDVDPGVADRLTRGGESSAVAELGKDRDRRQLTDPVMAHQRAAPQLATRIAAQLLVKRRDLGAQCIDHRDSDRDLLTRSARDPNTLEPCSPLAGEQIQLTAVWQPVVIEHRTNP